MALLFNPQNHISQSNPEKPYINFLRRTSAFAQSSHVQNLQTHVEKLAPDHKLVVVGGSKLSGHVNISGSKNSALAVLAGTLCCSGTSKLHNMPNLSDTRTMVSILRSLGVRVQVSNGEMTVDTDGLCSLEPCSDAVGKIRAGLFVLGPLLTRFGEAVVALPGGCDIGARPVDLYIRGLRALGAIIELRNGKVHACAVNGGKLVGGRFHLDYPSVGATETLMMAASMADGMTVLTNVAQEPEVVDLAHFLIRSGAHVEGAGSGKLVINGRNQLHGPEFTIMPDRIEAGTFMVAAAITRSHISISPVIPLHLLCLVDKLSAAGCKIMQSTPNTLEVSALPAKIGGDLQGFDVKTVRELQKLGAKIHLYGNNALIHGKEQGSDLSGSQVVATDLRSGASLVLAGMAAEGITVIDGVTHIDRGYENLEMKLRCLGADIRRHPFSIVTGTGGTI